MLEVRDLHVSYGMLEVLHGINLRVGEGEIVALIGPNGAGKTTLLKTVSGLLWPTSGQIEFMGRRIDRMPAEKIIKLGISHCPEGRRVFARSTVLENLEAGAFTRSDQKEIQEDIAEFFRRFPVLEQRKNQYAGTLSGGEQQMLAISRALMSRPKLLLLDEPSMGLAPQLVAEVFRIIKNIYERGTTILLVEQNAKMALTVAHRAYVLEAGEIQLEGLGRELLNDESVRRTYLGET